MAKGGKRIGAGRPKGTPNLPRFTDFVDDDERREFVKFVSENYRTDMRLAVFFGQSAFAKPVDHVDHTTNGKDLPTPILLDVQSDHRSAEDKEPQ